MLAPMLDSRLRYEHVGQDGLSRDAEALTFRTRAGAQLLGDDWSALAEVEATVALSDRYDDGLSGRTRLPLVADPETVELNRIQLQYRGLPQAVLTMGRQRINLDDQRFVGAVDWRQNEQTFDAVRIEWAGLPNIKADLSYVWSVRTIWGRDGHGARQQAIGGDNLLANLGWKTPVGTLTIFAYLVDQDEVPVSGYRLSSQTYGLRLAGTRSLLGLGTLGYAASYARQTDWHRNPNDYSADYWLADATLDLGGPRLGAGFELLGADKGQALTSFQTPLATAHKFQGWADKFLTTPPDGIRDLYASTGYGWQRIGPFEQVNVQAIYHRYDSDRDRRRYGTEWNLVAGARLKRVTLTAKYANYQANGFATDTRKFWLQLDYAY